MHIELDRLASCQRLMGDPLRLLMLRLLMERELCVCEIIAALGEPQYKVSRHLGMLKRTGLLLERRQGTRILCRLRDDLPGAWATYFEGLRRLMQGNPRVEDALAWLRARETSTVPAVKLRRVRSVP